MTFKYNNPISLNQQPPCGRILSFSWERCFCFCKYLLLSILLLSQVLINPVNAEWGRTADEVLRLPIYRDAHICSDGNGGCWATGEGVSLSHVDRNGNITWGDEPFILQPRLGFDQRPVLADNGDVIVAMRVVNEENGLTDVFIQRVNIDQEFLWGEAGIQLDTSSRYESLIGVDKGPVQDTYLIHWIRHDENWRNYDNRFQLINGDGEFLWDEGSIGLNIPPITPVQNRFLNSGRRSRV